MTKVSVILPTDTFETIESVVQRFAQLTNAETVDLIIVTPNVPEFESKLPEALPFASIRVLESPDLAPLGKPRAIGVRAARTPYVFIGETHSYLFEDSLEKLLACIEAGPWASVVPGFYNANPNPASSWAAFFVGYSRWSATLPEGEIKECPLYDNLVKREVLLELGDALPNMLSSGDGLRKAMERRGFRIFFEPSAGIEHINIEVMTAWFHEHYLLGRVIGAKRAGIWPWWRRILYMGGSPLVPFVLLRRSWSGMQYLRRKESLPRGTFLGVVALYLAKALGEFTGYATGISREHEIDMTLYEIRRLDYVDTIC